MYDDAKKYTDQKIVRTHFQYDIEEIRRTWEELSSVRLSPSQWYQNTQTMLQHSDTCTDPYTEGCGSIKRAHPRTEKDFRHLNPIYKGTIFEDILKEVGACRSRIMIKPKHTCYSLHSDRTGRYHLPIITNPQAFFVFTDPDNPRLATLDHIPADGHVYWTNTTRTHSFLNGGDKRTHLVMCES